MSLVSRQRLSLSSYFDFWHMAIANMRVFVPGVPVKFSEQKPSIRLAPPTLGQHTDDVLREMGISDEEVAQLREQGVV
jgi:succinate--hydroxymethylglutarate CoA-transferase